MVYKFLVSTLLSASFLVACTSTDHTKQTTVLPNWVYSPPTNKQFLYAVGVSNNKHDQANAFIAAQEHARLELAKTLNLTISGVTSSQQTADNQNDQFSYNQDITNTVEAVDISGAKLVDHYVDDNTNTLYCLLAFDVLAAAKHIENKIYEIDKQTTSLSITKATPSITLLKFSSKINQLKTERNDYNQQLSYLKFHKVKLTNAVSKQYQLATEIINKTPIFVPNHSPEIQQQILFGLSSLGFNSTEKRQTSQLTLDYQVDWQRINKQSQVYFIANVSINLLGKDKNIHSHQEYKLKGVSKIESLAKQKAIDKFGVKFKNSFKALLTTL